MAGRIKGITIEINGDTTGLDKALSSVNSSANKTQSELRDVNKLLKLDPGNTELIAQKQKLLAQAITQTGDKLKTLKDAQAQVDAQFAKGDIGEEQYRAFQREIASTEATLKGYKSQLSTAANSQQELSQSTKRLETFFKATGTEIDDFKSVIGTRLVNAIKNGTASSESMDKALQMIAKEAGIASSGMSKLTQSLDKVDDNNAGISSVSKEIQSLSKSTEATSGKLGTFTEKLKFGSVAGIAGKAASAAMDTVTGSIDDAIRRVDTLNAFPKVLQNFGFSAKDAKNATAEMSKSIEGLPTTMDQAVESVQGYVGATGNLNQSVELFQATNDAAMVFAQGSQDAMSQFSMAYQQSLAAGKVEAENFNSMNESMPGLMNKVASSMGISMSQLKDGLSDGSISIGDFNTEFTNLDKNGGAGMQALSKSAQDSSGGIATSMKNVKTEVVKTMASLIEAVGSENIKNAFKAIQDAIKAIVEFVKQNKDWLLPLVAGLTAVVVAVQIIMPIITAFSAIITALTFVFSPLGIAIMAVVAIIAIVVLAIKNWSAVVDVLKAIWGGLEFFFGAIWNGIKAVFTTVIGLITTFIKLEIQGWVLIITTVMNVINGVFSTVWNAIKSVTSTVWNGITSVISTVVNTVKTVVTSVWNGIKEVTSSVFNAIKSVATSVWDAIKSAISSVVNGIKSTVTNIWNEIQSVTSSVFNAVKSTASSVWNGIKSTISSVVDGIKSTVSNVWNGIKSVTTSVWNGIKSAITAPIEAAKGVISGIVDSIKGLFNFRLSFPSIDIPHIPLPHFNLSGSFNPLKGKIPHIGVNWYAKGGIFNKPTMFAAPGGFNGIGEAGPEAALPLNDKTLGGIGKGIAEATGGLGGDTYQITIQVLADTSAQTIKKLTDAVTDGITRAQNSKARAIGG